MIEPGQIVFANLVFQNKNKQLVKADEIIISREYDKPLQTLYFIDEWKDKSMLLKCGLKDDAILLKVNVINHLGYKNNPKTATL